MKFQKVRKISAPNGSGDICSYCREPIKWYETTCGKCGNVLGQKYFGCPDCGKGYPPGTTSCLECESGEKDYEEISIVAPPMRYYFLLTYFLLPLRVLSILYYLFYARFIEINILAPALLFFVILLIITIYALYNKISWSWKLLILVFIYNWFVYAYNQNTIVSILSITLYSLIFIWPTYAYFNKRKNLFSK